MNPYSASILAREIYRERVRESLARHAAHRRAAPPDTSRESWTPSISWTRFQTSVRWLVAELFLS